MRFRLLSAALLVSVSHSAAHAGTTIPFDADWRFTVGDPPGRRTQSSMMPVGVPWNCHTTGASPAL